MRKYAGSFSNLGDDGLIDLINLINSDVLMVQALSDQKKKIFAQILLRNS